MTFEDRTACAQGGSSRSAVVTASSKGRPKSERYQVSVVPFSEVLQDHTVVKMDCEGAELPILLKTTDWKQCRLLVTEISVRQMRKAGANAWQDLADIFDNLRRAGFRHARLSKTFFELKYWKESGDKRYAADGIIWFVKTGFHKEDRRQEMPKSCGKYCIWRHFRYIMQRGGLLPGTSLDQAFLEIPENLRR